MVRPGACRGTLHLGLPQPMRRDHPGARAPLLLDDQKAARATG